MILVDVNQITIAGIMAESKGSPVYDENLIRHIILNTLRTIKQKQSKTYGEIVLCYDGHNSWRKSVYKYYKSNRKKNREKSEFDWKKLFDFLSKVREEMKEFMPYKVLHLENCEADDLIAVVCKNYAGGEAIQIISSDTDFVQLQKYRNVHQYSPILKKQISSDDPAKYLFEHVLRGDTSDGIPNILSDDDTFEVEGKRQRSLSSKKVDMLYQSFLNEADWTRNLESPENYARNRTLIDFECIPQDIQEKIINMYESSESKDRSRMIDYFIKYGMKYLMEHIGEY